MLSKLCLRASIISITSEIVVEEELPTLPLQAFFAFGKSLKYTFMNQISPKFSFRNGMTFLNTIVTSQVMMRMTFAIRFSYNKIVLLIRHI